MSKVDTDSANNETTTCGFVRKTNPFTEMRIADNSFLSSVTERHPCPKCNASRKFFCYTCYVGLPDITAFPEVDLPVKIDIIKHHKETDGKSTSAHAAILAPRDVRIYEYPRIPDYTLETGVVLIYPSQSSVNVHSLFTGEQQLDTTQNFGMPVGQNVGTLLRFRLASLNLNDDKSEDKQHQSKDVRIQKVYDFTNLPVKRAVFIDSTWNQSRSIYKDKRVRSLQCVVLQNRLSQFWRHHKGSPRWYLSTVEAVHQFLLEVHAYAWGRNTEYRGLDELEISEPFLSDNLRSPNDQLEYRLRPYDGHYDNLLFLFTHMYGLIHTYYDHNQLKAYKRPIA